jgi:subtilisin family serine protease
MKRIERTHNNFSYIVKLKNVHTDASAETAINGICLRNRIVAFDKFSETFRGFSTVIPDNVLERVRAEAQVDSIEPDLQVNAYGQYVPWGIKRCGVEATLPTFSQTNIENVHVFILDTGVQRNHPDLSVVESLSFVRTERSTHDRNGHGTMVAGVLAAKNNDSHVVGVAPGSKIHSYKVLDARGSGSLSNVISAIDRVIRYKKSNPSIPVVVNLSLGGFAGTTEYNSLDLSIRKAIVDFNICCVVAAGNEFIDASLCTPAHVHEAITVGSYNEFNRFSSFSNYGSIIDVLAPGENVLTTFLKSSTAITSGTSFSAPHVAGVAALILASNNKSTPGMIVEQIKITAKNDFNGANPKILNVPLATTNCSVFVA